MVPVLGLVPVLVATVLATQGSSGGRAQTPVASGPTGAPTLASTVGGQTAATVQPAATQIAPPAPTQGPAPTAAASRASVAAPTVAASSSGTSSVGAAPASANELASGNASGAEPFVAYHVQPGDTVRFIAQMYGVSGASIAQASGLTNPDQLRIGQILTIPAKPGWLYRVQPGETLDQVAARTGVPSGTIASASGLVAASVRSGDVLLIPDQTVALSK
jgi:LysM repeat protein